MSIQLRSGGWWVGSIAGYGELEWSHAADGGCKEASWRMDLPPKFAHSALVRGSIVEIRAGSSNVWKGVLTEPDMDDDWTFHAVGLSSLGRGDFTCLDGSGNSTSIPDVAIDRAISDGLPWQRDASLSSAVFGASEETDGLNYVGDLLDAWADSVGKRWGVDPLGRVYAAVDPVEPMWHLTPGSGRLGLADDNYASHLVIRYLSSTGGGYATVIVGDEAAATKFGRREFPVDATGRAPMSSAAATAFGEALLSKGAARQGYTNGIEVTKYQLTYPGGGAAHLPFVMAGDLVRMHGVLDEQAQPRPYLDWVIGETSYQAGADTITLTPVGLVDRTLADVLTAGAA